MALPAAGRNVAEMAWAAPPEALEPDPRRFEGFVSFWTLVQVLLTSLSARKAKESGEVTGSSAHKARVTSGRASRGERRGRAAASGGKPRGTAKAPSRPRARASTTAPAPRR